MFAQITNSAGPLGAPSNRWLLDHPTLLGTIVVASLAAYVILQWIRRHGTTPPPQAATVDVELRHMVAKAVLRASIWGLVALATAAVVLDSEKGKELLTILLPVFGTWVGTLLAYYFGKENFESGAKNSAEVVRQFTALDRLRTIPVLQPGVMIAVGAIKTPQSVQGKGPADYGTIELRVIYDSMIHQRLPLIDPADGSVTAVIHKSLISDFLLRRGTSMTKPTLKDLLDDAQTSPPGSGWIARNSFVLLPRTATLADVKQAMEDKSTQIGTSCEDAFITAPGSPRVEGWITNDIVNKFSQA